MASDAFKLTGTFDGGEDIGGVLYTHESLMGCLMEAMDSWHEDDPRRTSYVVWENDAVVATIMADPEHPDVALVVASGTLERYRVTYRYDERYRYTHTEVQPIDG